MFLWLPSATTELTPGFANELANKLLSIVIKIKRPSSVRDASVKLRKLSGHISKRRSHENTWKMLSHVQSKVLAQL